MSQSQKCIYFEKTCPKIKRNYFPLMTAFCNFALKTETSYAKMLLSPFWKPEMPLMMFLCMFG